MKFKIFTTLLLIIGFQAFLAAQSGPGGIGDTTGLSPLQLWLRAHDLSDTHSNGQKVTEWNDVSGANNHVMVTSDRAPYFNSASSYAGIDFLGSQYLQTNGSSSSFSNTSSSIFVVKRGGFEGTSVAIASNSWSEEMLLLNHNQYHHNSSGNFQFLEHQCLMDIAEEEITVINGIFGQKSGDLQYFVNGLESNKLIELRGSPSDYSLINRKVTIGQRDRFVSSEYLTGTILEVIVYNTQLSEAERQAVEEYLRCKYEITTSHCTALSSEECTTSTPLLAKEEVLLTLLPNPANDYIQFTLSGPSIPSSANFNVYDQLGRNLLSSKTTDATTIIDVSAFTPGIYYLQISLENRQWLKKIIVQ